MFKYVDIMSASIVILSLKKCLFWLHFCLVDFLKTLTLGLRLLFKIVPRGFFLFVESVS